MDPLNIEGLPANALVLVDTAPIIYVLEGHPQLARRFRPLFEAHEAGALQLAITTVTITEVMTGPEQAKVMTGPEQARDDDISPYDTPRLPYNTARFFRRGVWLRLITTSRVAPRCCGPCIT